LLRRNIAGSIARYRSCLGLKPIRIDMTRTFLALGFALAATLPAAAQVTATPTGPAVVVPSGAPGVVSQQAGTTGNDPAVSYSPTGRPADTISNDSAAAGNAAQPSRVAPQGGGGGGNK
jgi:hypothetical protein